LIGFASLLGTGVFLLAVLVWAFAVRTDRRRLGAARWSSCLKSRVRERAHARSDCLSRPQMDLSTVTDEQLCYRWRVSYLALLDSSPDQMKQTVVERERYLDEFERRDRTRFAAWLASGPLASASPMPYAVGVRPINWDDLTREQGS